MMEEVIEHFGGRSKMAEFFAVERAAITQWASGALPPKRAIEIEEFTQGVFKAIDLMEWAKSEQEEKE